jgi:hypothetical protein
MDKLEDYIRENRKALDMHTPKTELWNNIEKSIKRERSSRIIRLSSAAMIIVILGTSIFFYNKKEETATLKNFGNRFINSNPQLKETEMYYNNLVNSLYTEATPLLTGHPDIQKELTTDMSQLDSICSDIKNDLKDNIANQEVIEAMIQNYRIKIKLLEDMLTILKQEENNKEKKSDHVL